MAVTIAVEVNVVLSVELLDIPVMQGPAWLDPLSTPICLVSQMVPPIAGSSSCRAAPLFRPKEADEPADGSRLSASRSFSLVA